MMNVDNNWHVIMITAKRKIWIGTNWCWLSRDAYNHKPSTNLNISSSNTQSGPTTSRNYYSWSPTNLSTPSPWSCLPFTTTYWQGTIILNTPSTTSKSKYWGPTSSTCSTKLTAINKPSISTNKSSTSSWLWTTSPIVSYLITSSRKI